jgi:hypothetical protein
MIHLKRYTKLLICSAGLLAAALLAGCGSGDQGRDPILGVPAATLASIAVTPATASVAIGAKQQFTATASYSDGSARDISANAAWSSATTSAGTVTATGLATGLRAGTTLISAAFEGKSGNATLTVQPATVLSLALTPALTSFQVGATQQLAAAATYSDGSVVDVTATAAFLSATPASVTVATGGLIRAVASGTSALSASFGGKIANAQATVTLATVATIAVTPANAIVVAGGTQQYIAVATYSDNSTAIVTRSAAWTSGAAAIATVANTGVASGVAAGTTTISASLGGKSGSGNLTVTALPTVPPATPPAVPPVTQPPVASVNLRSAANFAVLAGTALTNNSGGTTLITGNVGSPSQTTDPTLAAGYTNYKSGAILDTALADLQSAISDANGRSCDVSFAGNIDLGGLALPPGVYCYAGTISVTGTLILSGQGVYIFRTAQTLNTTANSTVALTNGATADNITWVPVGPTTLGANSVFKGSILGQSAAITVGDNTTLLNGRVLSGAAVTLRNNQITK